MTPSPVIFFDGLCNLCDGFVDFVIRRDRDERFLFATLQSDAGEWIRSRTPEDGGSGTVIVLDGERVLTRSTAALFVLSQLGAGWRFLSALARLVPRAIRDAVYRWVARRRRRWFGVRDTCRTFVPELSGRVVERRESLPGYRAMSE